MKKYIAVFSITVAVLAIGSCRKDMSDLNRNPKAATEVPGEALFSNAQKNFADILTTPNVNNNIFEFISQYWAATTYPQESRYDLANRNIPQNWWTIIYRDVLRDLDESISLMTEAEAITEPQQVSKTNKIAIAKVLWVHAYSTLLNTFGDIPYTEALDVANSTPKYDDQETVYAALLDTLNASIAAMDESGESFGSQDLIYQGDVSHWYRYANSLKLRLAMNLADVQPARARALAEEAAPNVFTSNADNASFNYLTTPPNTNPIWTNLVQSNRNDFVPANTLVNAMNTLNDPRRRFYFTLDPNDKYSGGVYGAGNSFSNFSHVNENITEPDFPSLLLDYAEVEFLLAEAAARGYNVGGSAAEHYNRGVTASIQYWGGTAAEATAYLAQPSVNYATAPGDFKQKIGTQAWLALYLRGFDAWTSWRRLDYPALTKPASAITEIPIRYTYPSNEQNLNQENYDAASTAIGGDEVTTPLFWDIY